jgi:phosphoribosylaminoimidazolecarboxamide formyltransferase/IMP cyclohydrolase
MRTALLASYTKDEPLLRLARLLVAHDYALIGSAGTTKFLTENSIPCTDVATRVGPPILGHRVVTLAREIYAALLSRPEDSDELAKLGITPIDLVYVTLYPLEDTVAKGGTPEEVLEKTDIGGPTLLRAAAKGRRITLSDAGQIEKLSAWMNAGEAADAKEKLVLEFAAAAERRVANYVAASAAYWEGQTKTT